MYFYLVHLVVYYLGGTESDVFVSTVLPTKQPKHGMGWLPSLPDKRDERFVYQYPSGVVVPNELDWRQSFLPTILDQGSLGSCTSFAGKYALQYADYFNGRPPDDISELFQYYEERVLEHTTGFDSGANMRDIFKVMKKTGVVPEKSWPYLPEKFADKPPKSLVSSAKTDRIHSYQRVYQVRSLLQACLAARRTFLIGISVYESFESAEVAKTGIVPMPDLTTESLLGGHAICCVGYTNKQQRYFFLNSWGENWGDHGCFSLPFQYVEDTNLSGDCFTLTSL